MSSSRETVPPPRMEGDVNLTASEIALEMEIVVLQNFDAASKALDVAVAALSTDHLQDESVNPFPTRGQSVSHGCALPPPPSFFY